MAQDFTCFCNTVSCKHMIMGAKYMTNEQLEGMYLNSHIRELLEAQNKDKTLCTHGIEGLEQFCSKGHGSGVKPFSVEKVVSVNGAGSVGGIVSKGLDENSDKTKPSSVEKGVNDAGSAGDTSGADGANGKTGDPTLRALKASLEQAKKVVESAQKALDIYQSIHGDGSTIFSGGGGSTGAALNGAGRNGVGDRALAGEMGGDTRHGVTSREMSGEMGGDTPSTVVQVFAGGIVNVGV